MLAIVNVTEREGQELDDYEIRINSRVIGRFQHERQYNGAAQCLRDAADSLDKNGRGTGADLLESLLPIFKRMNDV